MTTTTQAPSPVPGSTAHTDGAWAPIQTRSERPRSYNPADFPRPTGREVNWKHTPVDRLAPLFEDADGDTDAVRVTVTAPDGVQTGSLAAGVAPRGEVFQAEDLPAAIAWQRETEAHLLRIPAGVELPEPVYI